MSGGGKGRRRKKIESSGLPDVSLLKKLKVVSIEPNKGSRRSSESKVLKKRNKLYEEYCLNIVKKAEKGGVLEELVILLSAFRVMYKLKEFDR